MKKIFQMAITEKDRTGQLLQSLGYNPSTFLVSGQDLNVDIDIIMEDVGDEDKKDEPVSPEELAAYSIDSEEEEEQLH